MPTQTTRKQRREHIAPFIIHSKALDKKSLVEEVLSDGSIKFYVRGFASTTTKDASGDIVIPSGIDLSRYLINPIIKIGHKRGEENNIGLTTQLNILPDGMYIEAEIILNDSIEMHKSIIHGLRHGLIKGFSIGFNNVVYTYDKEKDATIITSLQLHEISLVDIPDNPLTVMKAIQLLEKTLSSNNETMKTKMLGVDQLSVGQTVEFKNMYREGNEIELYPSDGYYVGTIISITSEGSVLKYGEAITGSVEDPIVTLQIQESINGVLVATSTFCVENYKNLWIEGVYTGEKSYTKYETKSMEEVAEKVEEAVEEIVETVKEVVEEVIEEVKEVIEEITSDEPTDIVNEETTNTDPENGTEPETVATEKSLKVEKSNDFKAYHKTLQDHEDSIIMLSEMLQETTTQSKARIEALEKTLSLTIEKMKSIVIDAPLNYVATKQPAQRAKTMIEKQFESIKETL